MRSADAARFADGGNSSVLILTGDEVWEVSGEIERRAVSSEPFSDPECSRNSLPTCAALCKRVVGSAANTAWSPLKQLVLNGGGKWLTGPMGVVFIGLEFAQKKATLILSVVVAYTVAVNCGL